VKRKKSPDIWKFGEQRASAPEQSQALFLPVVADDRCYFGYELSSLVVESIAMFGHRLIVTLFMLFI
jgi:hypothetical protein